MMDLTHRETENLYWIGRETAHLPIGGDVDSINTWIAANELAHFFEVKYVVNKDPNHFYERWGRENMPASYYECISLFAVYCFNYLFGDGSDIWRSTLDFLMERTPNMPVDEIKVECDRIKASFQPF